MHSEDGTNWPGFPAGMDIVLEATRAKNIPGSGPKLRKEEEGQGLGFGHVGFEVLDPHIKVTGRQVAV